jgi:uncharacterized OB-fold protein
MTESSHARPTPRARTLDPHRAGLERGELLMPRCPDCGDATFPPRELCASCASTAAPDWVRVSGDGVVWTYCVFHKQYQPAFPTPYNVAVIELAEGGRLVSSVRVDDHASLAVGKPVRAVCEPGPAGAMLYFAPRDQPA